jgi:hypothetical protein
MRLVFVDCEAYGGCPATGQLTEFGAVRYPSKKTFYGRIVESIPRLKIQRFRSRAGIRRSIMRRKCFLDLKAGLLRMLTAGPCE